MTKWILWTCALASMRSHALTDSERDRYLDHARPLIESFLDTTAREYGVDLRIDPTSWVIRGPHPERAFTSYNVASPYGMIWPTFVMEFTCREVTVDLPARAARAHFYVAVGLPGKDQRGTEPEYRLVSSCAVHADAKPTVYLEPLPARGRTFTKRELVSHAQSLIQNLLKLNRETGRLVPDSFAVRGDWRWIYEWAYTRSNDCRAVTYRFDDRPFVAHVSIAYDQPDFATNIPIEVQSLLKDPVSLRTFRFALVRSCEGAGVNQPPELAAPAGAAPPPPVEATLR